MNLKQLFFKWMNFLYLFFKLFPEIFGHTKISFAFVTYERERNETL